MFQKHLDTGYTPAIPGIEMKTLVHGKNTLMTEFLLKKGSLLPRHSHPHEQTGYLVKGRIRLSINTESFEVMPGDSWSGPLPALTEREAELDRLADTVEDATNMDLLNRIIGIA